jgi:chromosome segregation ATPase
MLMNRPGAEMTPAQRAGFISDLAAVLQQELTCRDQDWERMGKFLNCLPIPSSISSGFLKVVHGKEGLANRIQELEEKRVSLEKDYWEAEVELADRRTEVGVLSQHVQKVRRERHNLQDLSRRQQQERQRLAKELKAARDTLALEEGVRKSLQVATEATKIILEVDKEVLIQKQLQVLYKGEAQTFPRLYKSMQDFSNDIMQVQEGLEREF